MYWTIHQAKSAVPLLLAAAVVPIVPAAAAPIARTPSISGDIWVAVAIVAALVVLVAIFVRAVFRLERRDARLGRDDDDDGATPLLF
jgi:membrane protein implicated in regulation of membrane protease activity